MKWILRYLKGISDTSICYDSQNLELFGFWNADFAFDQD